MTRAVIAPWMDQAACHLLDPDLFFPTKNTAIVSATNAARRVCAGCPVRDECLEYALANNERWGVWGGLTRQERVRLRQARRRLGAA